MVKTKTVSIQCSYCRQWMNNIYDRASAVPFRAENDNKKHLADFAQSFTEAEKWMTDATTEPSFWSIYILRRRNIESFILQQSTLPSFLPSLDNRHERNLPQAVQHAELTWWPFARHWSVCGQQRRPGTGKRPGTATATVVWLINNIKFIWLKQKNIFKIFNIGGWSADITELNSVQTEKKTHCKINKKKLE